VPIVAGYMCSLRGDAYDWVDFFGSRPMGGDGWDVAAWAAAGLPDDGHLEVQLRVEQL
jgi:hypothetical protein